MSHANPRLGAYSLRESGLWLSDTTIADASSSKHGLLPKVGGTGKVLTSNGSAAVWTDVTGGSGGGGVLPGWVAYSADTPPASSHTEDDEFNVSPLDAKWTETLTGTPTTNVDTTMRGHYMCKITGNSQVATLLQPYAPAGDTSITAHFRGWLAATGTQIRFYLGDSSGTTVTNAMAAAWDNNAGTWRAKLLSRDSGVSTDRATQNLGTGFTALMLHLQRDTNTWSSWFSQDGWSWFRVGTFSKTFTVANILVQVIGPGSGFVTERMGIDWVRRDWITL